MSRGQLTNGKCNDLREELRVGGNAGINDELTALRQDIRRPRRLDVGMPGERPDVVAVVVVDRRLVPQPLEGRPGTPAALVAGRQ